MVKEEDLVKVCNYWSRVYGGRQYEKSELFSVGYIAGRKVDEPGTLQKVVRYSMLKFIKAEYASRTHNESVGRNRLKYLRGYIDRQVCMPESLLFEESEELLALIQQSLAHKPSQEGSKLAGKEGELIRMYFYEDKSTVEIAEELLVTPSAVALKIRQFLLILKDKLERRIGKCHERR